MPLVLLTLLDRVDLSVVPEALPLLEQLVDEMLHWNRRRNLTAIHDRDEVLEKHLLDSLTLLPFARRAVRLLDIGSGAGFPSLPLKIVCPELEVVSVDSVGKKIDFQRHMVRILGLKKYTTHHERVEALIGKSDYSFGFDLVTARALCSLGDLIVLAEPFLSPGGRLIAMKGPEGEQELFDLRNSLLKGGWAASLHRLKLPVSGAERCLIELSR